MISKLLIEDNSGDKDCFTIIPNYILNHSSATDQALYLQMKRLTADGKKDYCYPSFNYLLKQLHIGKKTLKKSLKYLIDHKWIDTIGKRQVITAGGYQWVNAYKINNIWSLNNEYYKGSSERDPLSRVVPKEPKGVLKDTKGGSVVACNKERIKNIKRTLSSSNQLKPYFRGNEMRYSGQKWWVINKDGEWLEFAGKKEDITWK